MTSFSDISTEDLLRRRNELIGTEGGDNYENLSTEELLKKKERLERSIPADVGRQTLIGATSGLAGAPRATFETGEFLYDLATDPRNTIRSLFGYEPLEEKSAAESLFGTENARKIAEISGIQSLIDLADRGVESIKESRRVAEEAGLTPFTKKGLPSRQEAKGIIEDLGIDVEPTSALGAIAGEFAGRAGESALFGRKAATDLALGGAAGETSRQLGLPEGVSNVIDIGVTLFRAKPSKAQRGEAIKKLSEKDIKNFSSNVAELPAEVKAFDSAKLTEEIANSQKNRILNQIDPRDLSREESVKNLREGVRENYTLRKAETSNLYDQVDQLTNKQPLPTPNAVKELEKIKNQVETLGLPVETSESVKKFLNRELSILSDQEATAAQKIKSKQRFNNFLDFEFPDPSKKSKAKSIFNPVLKRLRDDINRGLKSSNKKAFSLFRAAENSHANNASIFGKDAVQKLINTESPEKFAKTLQESSVFEDIKNSLKNSEDILALERTALDELSLKGTTAETRRATRDLRSKLNPRAQTALDEIIELNDSKSIKNKSQAVQSAVVSELADSAVSGKSPATTLNLMQTPEGFSLVEEALNVNKEGRALLEEVKKLFIKNIFSDIIDSNGINTKRVAEIKSNKPLMKSLEKVDGKRLTDFVDGADRLGKKLENSILRISKNDINKILSNPSNFGLGLGLLKFLGVSLGPLAKVAVAARFTPVLVRKLMNNQTIRSLVKSISVSPSSARSALLRLSTEIEKETEE